MDYKVIPAKYKDMKTKNAAIKKGQTHSVLCPDGTIANQTVMTEEEARVHCERLIALRLDLPRKHKPD